MLGATPPHGVRGAGPSVPNNSTSDVIPRRSELALLNGTHSARSRFALKSTFHPINGANGSRLFGVRFQTGGKSSKVHPSSLFSEKENTEPIQLNAPGPPYWMQSQAPSIAIPRSTTHSVHTSIPTEAMLLDRQNFHMYYQRDPEPLSPDNSDPLNSTDSFNGSRTLNRSGSEGRLKRLPLCSNNQPQLFFRVPKLPSAHPQMFRNSRLLREEEFIRTRSTGLPIMGRENDISPSRTMVQETFNESARFAGPVPTFGSHEAALPYFHRDSAESLHKSLNRVGIPTIRPNTSMSMSRTGALNDVSPSKIGRDIGEERNRTPPQSYQQTAFQSHMAQARARWQTEKSEIIA